MVEGELGEVCGAAWYARVFLSEHHSHMHCNHVMLALYRLIDIVPVMTNLTF